MKRFFLFALVATMFAACATDQTQDVAVGIEAPETLTVSFDEESRIELKNGKTVWSAGDLLSVFYRSNANEKWQFQGQTGDRSGAIKRVAKGNEATHELSNIVIVYPYNANYYINPRTYNVQATLPATQTYLADSYGLDGSVMISSSEYKNFSLKNVCGWLKVQLTGNGEAVRYITLKGNNGEQVAGEIYINSENASCELAAESGIIGDDMQVGGSMFEEGTVLTKVTLDCGNGVTLGKNATAFYIALPPQEFSKGLTIDIEAIDGSKMTKSTSNEITIERNAILPMTAFAYEGTIPEVFEITYATNDGNPLDPYTTEGFGANFVENVFDAATGKGALKFDGKITAIPENAFIGCVNLVNMNIPMGLRMIGKSAYNGCSSLVYMDIPQGTHTIGDKAFCGCSGMLEITIPSSVSTIGVSSFEGCSGKANINCQIGSSSSSTYGKFQKAKFSEIVIGEGVTYVGSWAFYDCAQLLSVVIPESLTTFYGDSFANCASIADVYISDLSKWCNSRFYEGHVYGGCYANPLHKGASLWLNGEKITDLIIPSDITKINDMVFSGCTSLTSVRLHDGVTMIGSYAFRECISIASINIPSNVTEIGSFAFYGCSSLKKVYVSDLAAWCKITFDTQYANPMNNRADLYQDGVLVTDLVIPSNTLELKDNVFYGCNSITSVKLGNRIASVGSNALNNCRNLSSFSGKFASEDGRCLIIDGVLKICAPMGLTSYSIPDSVTEIGKGAFYSCSELINVEIHDGVSKIDYEAFYGCYKLETVTIGSGITEIGYMAFYGSSVLVNVYCKALNPPTLKEDYAFKNYIYGRKIYVPEESVSLYKSRWYKYSSDIVGYDFENQDI